MTAVITGVGAVSAFGVGGDPGAVVLSRGVSAFGIDGDPDAVVLSRGVA